MMSHPDFVTHYHSVRDTPFRNLSDLAPADLDATVVGLMDRRRNDPNYKRVFGRKYMELRRRTEAKLRALFIDAGGRPKRAAPHYLFLGSSSWFADLYPDTCEVRVPLITLDEATTSITYPDSFVAMRLGEEFGLPVGPMRPYHDRVYRIGELGSGLIASRHRVRQGRWLTGRPSGIYRSGLPHAANPSTCLT